jgi:predicted transcriptional regulator
MYQQVKNRDADLKFAGDLFPAPEFEFVNNIALEIYNYCADGNQGISADWFEFYIDLYNIEEIEYMAKAMHIIRTTMSNFDGELDKIKKQGQDINRQAEEIMKGLGVMG